MAPDGHVLPDGFRKDIVGYCVPWSLRAGEAVHFKLSRYAAGDVHAQVVQLISGDDRPHGTGLIERPVQAEVNGPVAVSHQPLIMGSYGFIPDMPAVPEGALELYCYPTLLPRGQRQTLIKLAGLTLTVGDDGFYAQWQEGELHLAWRVQTRRWHHLRLTFGYQVQLEVEQFALGPAEPGQTAVASLDRLEKPLQIAAGDVYLAASAPGQAHFNGRLQAPRLRSVDETVAAWDFAQDIESQIVVDVSGHARHGQLFQNPTRGVCGYGWDGSQQSYALAPEQYAAIHFHADDLTNADWQDSLVWQTPESLPSGQYALKVEINAGSADASEDYMPFFVRPANNAARAKLAYLVPTASYLAYANQRLGVSTEIFGKPTLHHANDAFLATHPEVGFSMYEYHADGSGVHYSSRLRPVLNMKPKTITWAFNADTHLTAWLDDLDEPFDVLTDEDLHLEGSAALSGYQAVITGTHPEYYSTEMRNGLVSWLSEGGRLMYMGGNGFYWRVAFQPDNPAIMEVRRAEDGTRAWMAQPGEYYHQFGGEYGGLWRRLGKPPNELVGIGFAAQGFDGGTYYRPAPGALDARVAFILEGVDPQDEIWGDFGNQGGGAAGEEIDRWDVGLGSPRHAVVIASSENHRPGMLRVKEEFHMSER
ncbi:MAG: N,N-dimethylformamidase beta subunit family domain-containing protein, partial [Pseudomonadota bacterium]